MFHIGDKVKIINIDEPLSELFTDHITVKEMIGREGVVVDFNEAFFFPCRVEVRGIRGIFPFKEDELEIVDSRTLKR